MGNSIGNIAGAFRPPPPPQLGGAQGVGQGGGIGGQFGQAGGIGQGGGNGMFGQGGVGFSGQSSFQPANQGQQQQGPRLPPPELMRDLGQALRIPPEQLAQKLMSGQSLSQVASSVGLDSNSLKSNIESFLSQRLPNLSNDQRSDMASHIIAGDPPRPPPLPNLQGGGQVQGTQGTSGI